MKMEQCSSCGGAVAALAKLCPHCGQPYPVAKVRNLRLLVAGFFVLAAVIITALLISKANQPPY